jgi:hypothetical protein
MLLSYRFKRIFIMPSKRTALLLNIFFSLGQMFLLPQPTQAAGINVVSDYGAIGDGIVLSDASITSGTNLLSSPSHPFVSADVGKQVALWAGGAGGFGLATTISSVSGGNALLATNAITTVTNGPAQVCTDNTAAFIGFDSQGYVSYPPDPRFFEYDTITAINAGTGVITLQNPLRYAYNGAWYDAPPVYGVTMGAPRLLDLNRTKMKISQNVTFSGGTFLSWYGSVNANARMLAGTIDATGARNITLTDVNATGLFVGESENVNFIRGTYRPDVRGDGMSEADKVVTNLTFTGTTISGFTQATGVKYTTFTNSTLLGQFQNYAENQTYQGNIINTNPALSSNFLITTGGSWYTPNQTYTGNTFHVTSGIAGISNLYNQMGFNVVASPAPTATSFAMTFSSGITNAVEVGEVLTLAGGSKTFTISSFTCQRDVQCIINGTSSGGSPVAGDLYYNNSPPKPVVSSANTFVSTTDTINVVSPSTTPSFNASSGAIQRITLSAGNAMATIANGTSQGQPLMFIICQPSSAKLFGWPSNVNNATLIGTTPNLCTFQSLTWDVGTSKWTTVLPYGSSRDQPGGDPDTDPSHRPHRSHRHSHLKDPDRPLMDSIS